MFISIKKTLLVSAFVLGSFYTQPSLADTTDLDATLKQYSGSFSTSTNNPSGCAKVKLDLKIKSSSEAVIVLSNASGDMLMELPLNEESFSEKGSELFFAGRMFSLRVKPESTKLVLEANDGSGWRHLLSLEKNSTYKESVFVRTADVKAMCKMDKTDKEATSPQKHLSTDSVVSSDDSNFTADTQ